MARRRDPCSLCGCSAGSGEHHRSIGMTGRDLLDEFAIKAYEPPLSNHRDSGRVADTSDPLSLIMLVVDLETEVSMNGIADFIGNRTGLYANETVVALKGIGCHAEADLLAEILRVAHEAGMSRDAIQAERAGLPPYAVTSFAALHGSKWDDALARIDGLYEQIDFERVLGKAEAFVAEHEQVFRQALGR